MIEIVTPIGNKCYEHRCINEDKIVCLEPIVDKDNKKFHTLVYLIDGSVIPCNGHYLALMSEIEEAKAKRSEKFLTLLQEIRDRLGGIDATLDSIYSYGIG